MDDIICDDEDPCTLNDTCTNGSCAGPDPLDCDDADACTKDLCQAPGGCYYEPAEILPCNDDSVCTTDSCEPATGCVYTPVADYTPCDGGNVCLAGACLPPPESSIVFLTASKYTGNLGGLAGADAKCQAAANAAGLPGTYVAFLSTNNSHAKDRIPDPTYLLVDNTVVADSKADLLDGSLDAPINLAANGASQTNTPYAWTGSNTDGTTSGHSCGNWTMDTDGACGLPNGRTMSGDGGKTTSKWIVHTEYCCWASFTRLYCFQTTP